MVISLNQQILVIIENTQVLELALILVPCCKYDKT
jgi:hypothetical protein